MDASTKTVVKWSVTGVIGVVLLVIVLGSFHTVDAGHVGVVTRNGAVTGDNLQPGFHIITPLVSNVIDFSTQVQQYSEAVVGKTTDSQVVSNTMNINYALNARSVSDVYQNIGTNYADTVLTNSAKGAFQDAISQYTAERLASQQQDVADKTQRLLIAKLNAALVAKGMKPGDITILQVNFTSNFTFSDQYNAAIERKQIAQQNVLTAQQALNQAKVDAQNQVVQAQAAAQARLAQAGAAAQAQLIEAQAASKAQALQAASITPNFLQLTALNRWDGHLPTYSTGSGGFPFLGVSVLPSPTPSAPR